MWWQFFGDNDDDVVGTFDLKVATFWIGSSDRRGNLFLPYHLLLFFLCFMGGVSELVYKWFSPLT